MPTNIELYLVFLQNYEQRRTTFISETSELKQANFNIVDIVLNTSIKTIGFTCDRF